MLNGYGSLLPDQTINDIQFELTPEMLQQELDKELQFYVDNTLEKSRELFRTQSEENIDRAVSTYVSEVADTYARDPEVVIEERSKLTAKIREERDRWYDTVGSNLPNEERNLKWNTFLNDNIRRWNLDTLTPATRVETSMEDKINTLKSINRNKDNLWGDAPGWVSQRFSDSSQFDYDLIKYQSGMSEGFANDKEREDFYIKSFTASNYLINLIDNSSVVYTDDGRLVLPTNMDDREAVLNRQGLTPYRQEFVQNNSVLKDFADSKTFRPSDKPYTKIALDTLKTVGEMFGMPSINSEQLKEEYHDIKFKNRYDTVLPTHFPNNLAEYDKNFNSETLTTIYHKSLNQRGFTAHEILTGKTREGNPLPGTVVNFRHARLFKNKELLQSHHKAWNDAGQDENGKELPTEEAKARREQTVYGRMLKAMNLPETYIANGRQLWTVDLISTHQKILFGVN